MKLSDFTLFAVDKGVYIALPVDEDGTYDSKLVFMVGTYAMIEYKKFNMLF